MFIILFTIIIIVLVYTVLGYKRQDTTINFTMPRRHLRNNRTTDKDCTANDNEFSEVLSSETMILEISDDEESPNRSTPSTEHYQSSSLTSDDPSDRATSATSRFLAEKSETRELCESTLLTEDEDEEDATSSLKTSKKKDNEFKNLQRQFSSELGSRNAKNSNAYSPFSLRRPVSSGFSGKRKGFFTWRNPWQRESDNKEPKKIKNDSTCPVNLTVDLTLDLSESSHAIPLSSTKKSLATDEPVTSLNDTLKTENQVSSYRDNKSCQTNCNENENSMCDTCPTSRTASDQDGAEDEKNLEKEAAQKEHVPQHEMTIAGIVVKFPVKPYPCQIAVMNMLIKGCMKEQNCLLESPTGSGKTLALLCSALAWQDHYAAEVQKQIEEQDNAELFDDYDFQSFSEHTGSAGDFLKGTMKENEMNEGTCNSNKEECSKNAYKRLRVPKIYYGSRTHKQLEQVVHELKRTAYSSKKMTILSSRELTCIQETDRNKTDLCNDLLDPQKQRGCPYYNENNKTTISSYTALNRHQINNPWDIEDLVSLGKRTESCPYFAARALMDEADIIFCPYNYLIDPEIRENVQIEPRGKIIILDEAHNMEDICREVASVKFQEDRLVESSQECEDLSNKRKNDHETYDIIRSYFLTLVRFIKIIELKEINTNNDQRSSICWTGVELMELFGMHELGKKTSNIFLAAGKAAIMDFNKAKEDRYTQQRSVPVISFNTKRILEQVMFTLQMINSDKFANDYRACIIETTVKSSTRVLNDTWSSTSQDRFKRVRSLQLMCMNPAVTFAPLATLARSVILTSGTLAPTTSFQSELGTVFHHTLHANHVIPKSQIYIRGIAQGPTGITLKANYTNVNKWDFQDELGKVLFNVCQSVPHGVLCFFSSYNMMSMQIERWRSNGYWKKLESIKHILQEPRWNRNLEEVMTEYRDVIRDTANGPLNGITGALLFAVFRGKIAEGIDFSDNEARCVLAVGIPYAVRKDPMIDMKFLYNNLNQSRGLLRGGEWYAVQAFRALNQALGRCIRHKNDWGAILLVDERFLSRSNVNYLPKWVRSMWMESVRYDLTDELKKFVAKQIERDENKLKLDNK